MLIFKPQISKTQQNVPESVHIYIYIFIFIFYIYLPTFKVRKYIFLNSFSKQRTVDLNKTNPPQSTPLLLKPPWMIFMAQALKFSDALENPISHPPLFKWLPRTEWRISKRKTKNKRSIFKYYPVYNRLYLCQWRISKKIKCKLYNVALLTSLANISLQLRWFERMWTQTGYMNTVY